MNPTPRQYNAGYNVQHASLPRPARFARSPAKPNNGKARPSGRNNPPHNDHKKHGQTSKETHPPRRSATAEDTCFNCGKKGHFSNNCPNPPKPKRDFVRAARSTQDGEDNEDPNDRNYQVSEADDEREDDEELMIPPSEQEYQEMEIPASELYENYDKGSDEESMAAMTVSPMERTPDIIAASNVVDMKLFSPGFHQKRLCSGYSSCSWVIHSKEWLRYHRRIGLYKRELT